MKLTSLLNDKKKDYFYIMHLSYDGADRKHLWECAKENNIIGLNHCGIIEHDWRRKRESLKKKNCISEIWARQLDMFHGMDKDEMGKDDIVVVLDGWSCVLGIAENLGGCNYDKNRSNCNGYSGGFFGYTRKVEWRKSYEWDKRRSLKNPVRGFNNTLSKVDKSKKWWTSLVDFDF